MLGKHKKKKKKKEKKKKKDKKNKTLDQSPVADAKNRAESYSSERASPVRLKQEIRSWADDRTDHRRDEPATGADSRRARSSSRQGAAVRAEYDGDRQIKREQRSRSKDGFDNRRTKRERSDSDHDIQRRKIKQEPEDTADESRHKYSQEDARQYRGDSSAAAATGARNEGGRDKKESRYTHRDEPSADRRSARDDDRSRGRAHDRDGTVSDGRRAHRVNEDIHLKQEHGRGDSPADGRRKLDGRQEDRDRDETSDRRRERDKTTVGRTSDRGVTYDKRPVVSEEVNDRRYGRHLDDKHRDRQHEKMRTNEEKDSSYKQQRTYNDRESLRSHGDERRPKADDKRGRTGDGSRSRRHDSSSDADSDFTDRRRRRSFSRDRS